MYGYTPCTPSSHHNIFPHKTCSKGEVVEKPLLIGRLTAALRLSKGWVRKDPNLVTGIGCTGCAVIDSWYDILIYAWEPTALICRRSAKVQWTSSKEQRSWESSCVDQTTYTRWRWLHDLPHIADSSTPSSQLWHSTVLKLSLAVINNIWFIIVYACYVVLKLCYCRLLIMYDLKMASCLQ